MSFYNHVEFNPFSEQPELHIVAPYGAAMLTYPANLRRALKDAQEDSSKTMLGIAHGILGTFVTKIIASTKPDFIWIDVEHGMFDRLQLHDAINAIHHHSEGRSMTIVRVPKHDEVSLATALDAGAAGIIIPHVESAQEVKEFIKEIYYPPVEHRSFSSWTFTPGVVDASLYHKDPYNIATSNNYIRVIPQIESVKGVENAEIASVPGVAALMFGPGDYMIDAGLGISTYQTGEPHPKFLAAVEKFTAAAIKNDLPIYGVALSLHLVPKLVHQGFRAIAVQFDVWGITRLIDDSLKKARTSISQDLVNMGHMSRE